MSAISTDWVKPWGDRTNLWPKSMVYALSLDVKASFEGRYLTFLPGTGSLYHVRDLSAFVTPEGLECDLPAGDVVTGTGRIGTPEDPSSVQLEAKLHLGLNDGANLLMDCLGVVNFVGGMRAFLSPRVEALSATCFLASRHETDSPTFRWLNRRQLFGVGRAEVAKRSQLRELQFTFDLYASA
jgi:Protein of unknown function (DUF3237)